MSAPEFADEIECAHCGSGIDVPLSTVEGREDYWLSDGQKLACGECGGLTTAAVSDDFEAYPAVCVDDACEACKKAAEAEHKERHIGA